MRPMKFDYLPSSPPDPIDVAHLERENDALRARVAELEAQLDAIRAAFIPGPMETGRSAATILALIRRAINP